MGKDDTVKNLTAEFIGTFLLVATVGNNVLGGSATFAALSIASVLMVAIYALGPVSGGHFNPAVTFSLFLGGHIGFGNAAAYMATQLVAGVLAGASYVWLQSPNSFNLAPGPGYKNGALLAEALYTFMLCFVVLSVCTSKWLPAKNSAEYFGLAIGFVIVAGGYAAGGVSGAAFNPAVAFGIDIASAGQGVYWSFLYTLAELAGAGLATLVHSIVDKKDGQQSPSITQNFISELLGTYFLVLTVGLNVVGHSPAGALSIAASLMCMIYALGHVSGAHFNPAVTISLAIAGKLENAAATAGTYIAAQLLGGLAAGVTYSTLTGAAFVLRPESPSWSRIAFAEVVYTFVLCFVVLNVAAAAAGPALSAGGKSQQIYGLAIGFCVVVGGFAIGSISGGSLNPAVTFGVDMAASMKGVQGSPMTEFAAYSAFEIIGGALAAGAYQVVRA